MIFFYSLQNTLTRTHIHTHTHIRNEGLYGFYKGLSAPFFAQTLTTALAFVGDHLAIKILQVSSEYPVNIFYTSYLTHTYIIPSFNLYLFSKI